MKIILSRKGFDSCSGGCPNPIFPGGKLLALPIPDPSSPVRYEQLNFRVKKGTGRINLGDLVRDLTGGRLRPCMGAHLDPDIDGSLCQRPEGWRSLFGQSGAAQGHLHKQNIAPGDLFLFFELFQPVTIVTDSRGSYRWQFDKRSPKRHLLWGWLQVDAIYDIDRLPPQALPWGRNHPHFHGDYTGKNCLYLGRKHLSLDREGGTIAGAGCFPRFSPELSLTAVDAPVPTHWHLPAWFYPFDSKGKPLREPLTYHSKRWRWEREETGTRLTAAARGQEFVLDSDVYPEAVDWVVSHIRRFAGDQGNLQGANL